MKKLLVDFIKAWVYLNAEQNGGCPNDGASGCFDWTKCTGCPYCDLVKLVKYKRGK